MPPETLPELQAFIELLRFRSEEGPDGVIDKTRREMWQSALKVTFGMWMDREDGVQDEVAYHVDSIAAFRGSGQPGAVNRLLKERAKDKETE